MKKYAELGGASIGKDLEERGWTITSKPEECRVIVGRSRSEEETQKHVEKYRRAPEDSIVIRLREMTAGTGCDMEWEKTLTGKWWRMRLDMCEGCGKGWATARRRTVLITNSVVVASECQRSCRNDHMHKPKVDE